MKDLTTRELPTWCPGCGDFNILFAVKNALLDLKLPREEVLLVSGIGCGSKLPHFVRTYGFEGLHGRSLPVATGAKLVNRNLKVIVVAGDGDLYGIGGNHFIHSMRRNLDITMIAQNNEVYGLTKGQYSPTSPRGFKTPSSPFGSIESPVNPPAIGLAMGATYVARGYSYEVRHLQNLIAEGVRHKGFALIDVFQPCSTYNKVNTIKWYKTHLYKLEEAGHNPSSKEEAWKKAWEWGEKIPIGLFFREERPTYEEVYVPSRKPVVSEDITNIDISPILERLK
jgi:2-oxoglutarate ferredoxin oxidoreductase subunit beta